MVCTTTALLGTGWYVGMSLARRLRWEGERQEQQGIGVATDLHRPICGGEGGGGEGGGVRLISVAGLGVLGSLVVPGSGCCGCWRGRYWW